MKVPVSKGPDPWGPKVALYNIFSSDKSVDLIKMQVGIAGIIILISIYK